VLLAIFLLLVIGIGACTALIVKAVGKPIKAGNNFAEALYRDPAEAANMVCPGSGLDAEALTTQRDALVAGGWTGSKQLIGGSVDSTNGNTSAIVTGTFGTQPVSIEMGKNGSDYCVTNLVTPGSVITDISIPDISIPDISIPDISIPDLPVPDLTVPAVIDGTDQTVPVVEFGS
jgi:hypothetical protein